MLSTFVSPWEIFLSNYWQPYHFHHVSILLNASLRYLAVQLVYKKPSIQTSLSPNMFLKVIYLFLLIFKIFHCSANNETINVFFNANESTEAKAEQSFISNFSLEESTICLRFRLHWDTLKMNIITIYTEEDQPFLNIFHQTTTYTFLQHLDQSILVKVK